MVQKTITDQLITQYFLDELTEQKRRQIEERCFTDSGFLERMQAIEAELIEDYVRGVLPGVAAEKLKAHMLASHHQQQKVEFASSLLRSLGPEVDSISPSVNRKSKNWSQSLLMFVRAHLFTPKAAVVAALAVFCLGGWLLLEFSRLRRELSDLQKEQAAAQSREQALREVIVQQQRARDVQPDSNTREPQVTQPEGSAEHAQKTNNNKNSNTNGRRRDELQHRAPEAGLASFSLSPMLMRGGQESPAHVDIPNDAKAVQIQLLYDADDRRSYHVVLETADGEELLTKKGLKAERAAGKKIVKLQIPADLLGNRTYVITLRESSLSGIDEDVSRYTFIINKK